MAAASKATGANEGSRVVVYGAGGHGRVVADAALEAGMQVLGFLDDAASGVVMGLPVLGPAARRFDYPGVAVALGIGDNTTRQRIWAELEQRGATLATVIHPTAAVSARATVAAGVVILAQAVVNAGARIGVGAIVNSSAVVEHDVVVGDFAHVSPGAVMAGGARAGALTHIGASACVLPGVAVGDGCIVGAGGVVTRELPRGQVAFGVPARRVRAVED